MKNVNKNLSGCRGEKKSDDRQITHDLSLNVVMTLSSQRVFGLFQQPTVCSLNDDKGSCELQFRQIWTLNPIRSIRADDWSLMTRVKRLYDSLKVVHRCDFWASISIKNSELADTMKPNKVIKSYLKLKLLVVSKKDEKSWQ